jgi:hypothetical protein
VATHREDTFDDDVPANLRKYRREDWPTRRQWRDAQRQWLREHPGRTIGDLDAVDLVYLDD